MSRLLLSASFVALSAIAANATTITTLPSENDNIWSWGLPDTSAYGQTFTLANAAMINDVSFRIDDNGMSVAYNLFIYAWDGAKAMGSALTSTTGATAGVSGMTTVTTSANNVQLGAGVYVAFLEALSDGYASWGSVSGSDAYGDGAFVFQNNNGDVGQVTAYSWHTNWQGPGADLAFAINTSSPSAVPLPAGLPLLGAGIGALGLLKRRRKQA